MQDVEKREHVKHLVREAAFDTKRDCENCRGTGEVAGGRLIIHSQAGAFGADWDLDDVLAAIDKAESVQWGRSPVGHDLVVTEPGGRVVCFDVTRPAAAEHVHTDECEHALGVLPIPGATTCRYCGDYHANTEFCPERCPVAYASLVEKNLAGA